MYTSDESGVMGFGPETKNGADKDRSIVYKLRSEGLIK